jgi:hypothetical protein
MICLMPPPPFALPWVTYYGGPGQSFHSLFPIRVPHSCDTRVPDPKAALFGQIRPSRYRSCIRPVLQIGVR